MEREFLMARAFRSRLHWILGMEGRSKFLTYKSHELGILILQVLPIRASGHLILFYVGEPA